MCHNTPLILQFGEGERIQSYTRRWNTWKSKIRCQERCKQIKEDLVAAVWHPRRVERLIETYGLEVLEVL
jgi:hypothetical protein